MTNTTREQRLRALEKAIRELGHVGIADRLYAILAEPVEVSDASDDEVRQWDDRHDLQLSITSAREAFEDAQTFHMLKACKESGQ